MISKSKKNKYEKKHTVKKNVIQKQKSLKNIKDNKKKILKKYKYKHGGNSNDIKVKYYYGTIEQKNLWKQYEELMSKDHLTEEEKIKLEELKKKYNAFEESIKYTFGNEEEKRQWKRLKELEEKNNYYLYGKSYKTNNPEKMKLVYNTSVEKLSDDEKEELDDLESKFVDVEKITIQKLNEERLIEEKDTKETTDKNILSPNSAATQKKNTNAQANVLANAQEEERIFIAEINKNINESEESSNFKNTVNGIIKYLMSYKFNKNDTKRNKILQKEQVNLLMYYFNLIFNKDFNSASRLHRYERLKMLISSSDKDQPQLSNTLKEEYLKLIEQYKNINESENENENENENESDNESESDNETTNQIAYQYQQTPIKNEETSSITNKSIIGLLSSISIIAIILGASMK